MAIILGGCATGWNPKHEAKSSADPTSCYSIVRAEFVGKRCDPSLAMVTYSVSEVLLGTCHSGKVGIIYFPETLQGNFPSKALLLLDVRNRSFVRLVGGDAARSVWDDTEANRRFLFSKPIQDLVGTPADKQLPRSSAIGIVRQHLKEDPVEYACERYEYGWQVRVTLKKNVNGAWVDYWIRDDGKLVFRSGGL